MVGKRGNPFNRRYSKSKIKPVDENRHKYKRVYAQGEITKVTINKKIPETKDDGRHILIDERLVDKKEIIQAIRKRYIQLEKNKQKQG